MLYIVNGDGSSYAWHRYNPLPKNFNIHQVVEIQADGDELKMISLRQKNLPMTTRSTVVHWFGDDARFIVANLLDD